MGLVDARCQTLCLVQGVFYQLNKMAEKVGFEPTVPFDITGFQDQLLKPLGHLSVEIIISNIGYFVKTNLLFWFNFN